MTTTLPLVALAGAATWTFLEYVLHRFVLHGVAPFSDWHRQHHLRPLALICSPTVLSAALFARFRSRQEHTFAEKILSAMRHKFGGHTEPPKGGKAG